MMRKCIYVYAALCLFMVECAPKKDKIPPAPVMQTPQKMVVYQMMTRLFGNKVATNKPFGTIAENGVGKFHDITEPALQSLKA